ncbi:hypothetical protein [Klebsiella pneumoniae]|uniref:hypothetical protein n=1 Tax=Klebsiella pneumoniae TaxID=573 RepID=UPI0018D59E17|nr:hypothetical protein [Klebsiella pneumoniae]
MSTYKTKNPLGSAAVKDLYDNAENVDKFVNDRTKEELEDRLGVLRKTWHGMEMIFSRFIDYITGRGEQAVAAIGWQELGNWAVGLAVDNRQQIVYYNGSWYKYLGELEHVIAGDSPENDGGVWSAANPTGKWSNIGDAALRSNLGSDEGLSLLGSVSPRSGLRNVITSYSGQSVLMKQAVIGGPVLNAIATHKPGLAVADDDYSTFITADGQVYQFDISAGVDFRLAGALLDGSNAGESIKKIVDTEVAKAITAGSIDACKKVVLIRPIGNSDLTQLILDTNETFIVPSFMSLWHVGQVRYKFNGLTKPAFRICNEIPGLTSSMVDFVDRQGAEVIKGNGYLVEIIGPNPATYDEWYALTQSNPSAVSSAAGIEFGNTYSSKTLLDCRDTIIENVAIERFHGGLRLHGFDTYINIFRNLKITSCVYTFYEPDADKSNAGENLRFEGGTFGNCYRSHFYINQVGLSRTYVGCSFDYARQNFLELRSSGRGNDFIYENCWIEGFGDFLIRQYPITDTWSFRKIKSLLVAVKLSALKAARLSGLRVVKSFWHRQITIKLSLSALR